jgi:antitoxin component YwqK of YwqJK toxin-antitoxin module
MTSYWDPDFVQCKATTLSGLRCKRESVANGYCTQHYNMFLSEEQQVLPSDLIKNVVSSYIQYDELKKLQGKISNLNIDQNRITTDEYDVVQHGKTFHIVETKIDNKVRTISKYLGKIQVGLNNLNEERELDGMQYNWHDNGKPFVECSYVNGKKDGIQYDWNDEYTAKWNYKFGKLEGRQYSWWTNGNKMSEFNYKNGNKDGVQYSWYKNGKPLAIENYIDGVQKGTQYSWDEKGVKSLKVL